MKLASFIFLLLSFNTSFADYDSAFERRYLGSLKVHSEVDEFNVQFAAQGGNSIFKMVKSHSHILTEVRTTALLAGNDADMEETQDQVAGVDLRGSSEAQLVQSGGTWYLQQSLVIHDAIDQVDINLNLKAQLALHVTKGELPYDLSKGDVEFELTSQGIDDFSKFLEQYFKEFIMARAKHELSQKAPVETIVRYYLKEFNSPKMVKGIIHEGKIEISSDGFGITSEVRVGSAY